MKKKIQIKFFVFEMLASEFITLNWLYQEENTCHRHSVCQETVLRFYISLTEAFCNTIVVTVIKKFGKQAALQFSTKFERIYHVAFRRIL